MIARQTFSMVTTLLIAGLVSAQEPKNPAAAALKNPVAATPESIAAGKKAYDTYCASCHGNRAQGAERAGVAISIIQEQGGKQPPDLTDDKSDHGSTDGEIYTVIKKGVPPTMMAGWDGRIPDTEIWSIVNYIRALTANENVAVAPTPAAPAGSRPALELADYVQMPITADNNGDNTRAQLARVNFMRDEPGGRRFFVSDLNGPLYILDKATKQFTTYLDFNGLAGRPGLFRKFTFERNFATGLINVVFDPDYDRNGVFYTIHMEDPTIEAPAEPKPGVVAGLDLSGYRTTPTTITPTAPDAVINRESVVIEWTDRNIANTTFEGTARELLRMQLPSPIHPLGEMTFNPTARRGDPEWRVMYIGVGDSGTGEQRDIRRLNPQRLDNFSGKILRIVPDLREHTATSTVSENGRYRIPNDNPFVSVEGARKEIWAAGLRNPHRLVWDVGPGERGAPRLLAFNIGLTSWETVVIVKKGANYGYPLREGPQAMTFDGMVALPADDSIPLQITDTIARGTVTPAYPVIAYPHTSSGGDAIAGGFVYRGNRVPALKGKLVFGDITTGHLWYADMKDVLSADDGNPTTLAPIHELETDLRRLVEQTFHARGGRGDALPGAAAVSGRGRVDVRFAEDNAGELFLLTKSDGMIRQLRPVGSDQIDGADKPQSPTESAQSGLQGTAWNAVELYGTAVAPQSAAVGNEPHLLFGSDGRLSGADGCNRFTGPYSVKGNGITFGQIIATQMACPTTDEIARRFGDALKGTSHWSIVKGRLEFYGATGKPIAVFERRPATSAGDTGVLQGTTWQLIKFVGGDDRILTPDDPAKYTIEFTGDRRLTARVDCNRGRGTWKATPAGHLELGPLALTRASCSAPSLHDQIVKQWTFVRSFVIKDGHLFLSLMADGGTYEFAPAAPKTP